MAKTMKEPPVETAGAMRQPTLATMGLGGVLDIFRRGRLPVETSDLVERVFGPAGDRGSLVISGASGIVGAGKAMQLGSRLQPYDVRIAALDFPGAPDGLARQYPGLVSAFGRDAAAAIMQNIVRLSYDGKTLPAELKRMKPRFLLEAIPEILEVKRAHYELFRREYPGIEIRSVTSGFPSRELGVGIAHPAFPHEINKVWEIVEAEPTAITQLFWSLGLVPIEVSDDWSFVLDVLFCGVTHAGLQYHRASNMPLWKVDKYVRRLVGPNPFRAHDAIGAAGANFLTWSCLHHLAETYGELFRPTADLEERRRTGQTWYPPNHFRPLVDWKMTEGDEEEFRSWILGPLFQMTSLMLHEKRGHLSHINAIGELCAQFREGILAQMRRIGPDAVVARVEAYHRLNPAAATSAWHPEVFAAMESPEWRQLYVNAEHDGTVGVVTINRESLNGAVIEELNRAFDWLTAEGVSRVILTGDFHLATQMVGADTAEFFPALSDAAAGERLSLEWSRTARRLEEDFEVSVGFVNGKRCLGGMLELMVHCHYLAAVEDARLGFPEVTLPVIPGMEGCHWPFRKAPREAWPKIAAMLLGGAPVKAKDAAGWLVDVTGTMEASLGTAWALASGGAHGIARRTVEPGALSGVPLEVAGLPDAEPATAAARAAIVECVRRACVAPLADALGIQAKVSGGFFTSKECRAGRVGQEYSRTMDV
ncbi:MAG TPA: enoyl-CoA hydratase-related protein [Candidatus Eisenbacteria bacterium]|nr:enoyl-CoA hydratase-related protein [Candidatus Eisenbacteria bacterium]